MSLLSQSNAGKNNLIDLLIKWFNAITLDDNCIRLDNTSYRLVKKKNLTVKNHNRENPCKANIC